jgi:ATPase subunit of ABC transporter with duplicated ATPase domains
MLLSVSNLTKAYGDNQVLNGATFTMHLGDKWGLVGANGVGKSTLVKIVAGEVEADAGTVEIGPGVEVGYLPQVLTAAAGLTVAELLAAAQARLHTVEARLRALEVQMALPSIAGAGDPELQALLDEYGHLGEEYDRLGGYDYDHRVAAVLTGQKRKLQIAQLMAARANLLLLDEPTNHISLDVLEQFEAALVDFGGAIVAISHDRRFLARVAQQVWELRDGRLIRYLGGWEEYQARAG